VRDELYNQFISIGRKTLPVLVKPLPDELISSWIMRYSQALLTKSHTFCKFILESENVWNRDIDLNASQEFLQALSLKTFLTKEEVYNTTLRSYYPNLDVHTIRKWIIPLRLYHRTRESAGLMLCPGCLKNDSTPYFRKKWRLSLSVVCPICEVVLIDQCPECKAPLSFHRLEVGLKESILKVEICTCYKCCFDFRKAKTTKANQSLVRLQRNLYLLLDKGFNDDIQYSHLYFDVIYQLTKILSSRVEKLKDFDREVCIRSGFTFKIERQREEFDKMTIDQRLVVVSKISWLLEEWPTRFLDVSRSTRTYSSYLLRDMKNIPYWYWRLIMENVYIIFTPWRSEDQEKSYLKSYNAFGEDRVKKGVR
jgi:hypothetical protein